jgi:Flp pilus assembly pilin Flp
MSNVLVRFVRDDSGQDLVEYSFLIVFIALVATVGLAALGVSINDFYNTIAGVLDGIGPAPVVQPGS